VLIAAGDGVAADEQQLCEVEPLVDVVDHVGRPRHCLRLSSSSCRTGRGGCRRLLPTRAEPAVPAMLRTCTVKC
jgi:hypothetical protein